MAKAEQKEKKTEEVRIFFPPIPPEQPEEETLTPLWLITFTDIMALMLTFFVLLYSMSVPNYEKWSEMTKAVTQGLTTAKTQQRFSGESQEIAIEKISTKKALDLNYLQTLLQQKLDEQDGLQDVIILQGDDRLVISLPSDLLFRPGNTNVGAEGKRAIYALASLLNRVRNRIEIIGHSDPTPISSERYNSNWELSLARAASVAGVMNQVGYERSVIVRGLSSSRYDEIDANMPADVRMKLARRVDIVIMKDSGRKTSFFGISG